jgi:hypothetical protein
MAISFSMPFFLPQNRFRSSELSSNHRNSMIRFFISPSRFLKAQGVDSLSLVPWRRALFISFAMGGYPFLIGCPWTHLRFVSCEAAARASTTLGRTAAHSRLNQHSVIVERIADQKRPATADSAARRWALRPPNFF